MRITEFTNKIAKLPLLHRVALAILGIVLIFGIFWQFIYSDLSIKKTELEEELEQTESKIYSQQKIARDLPKYQAEVKEKDEKLANILRELPDKKEIEGFLRSISLLAIDTGLEVLSFIPQAEQKQQFFAHVPVMMSLEGTFHQLVTFFDEVAHLPRIVNISDIAVQITSTSSEEIVLEVNCKATAFRYLDEGERPVEEDNKKKKRRK